MMIEDCGSQIDAKDIVAFETALNAKLPSAYREFLVLYNGCAPIPDTVDVPGAPGTPTDVQIFFGIGRSIESSDLSWNLALIEERCPNYRVLPIACDSGGNLFCLRINGGIASEVVYCDLDDSDCAIYEVASSFAEFVGKLRASRLSAG